MMMGPFFMENDEGNRIIILIVLGIVVGGLLSGGSIGYLLQHLLTWSLVANKTEDTLSYKIRLAGSAAQIFYVTSRKSH